MKRVDPTNETQVLYIIPRDYSVVTPVSVMIRQDGTYISQTISVTPSYSANSNYMILSCGFDILEEDSIYFMEVKNGSDLIYRDKLYSTSSSDYVHTLNTNKYTIDAEGENEQYIIFE